VQHARELKSISESPRPLWRIAGNASAHGVGIASSILLQLLTIPVLFSVWPKETVGQWLLIMTLPTYLALSDLGFTTAATIRMTSSFVRNNRDQQVTTFQSLLIVVIVLAAGLGGLAVLGVIAGAKALDDAIPWLRELWAPLVLVIAYSALQLLSRVPVAALRASNRYVTATFVLDGAFLVEGLAVLAVALLSTDLTHCAATIAIIRLLAIGLLVGIQTTHLPWLTFGFDLARLSEVRALAHPSIAAAAIPFSTALLVQGALLVAGGVLGPLAVAVLAPIRTLTRFPVLLVSVFSRGAMPEVAKAHAAGRRHDLKRINRTSALALIFVLLPALILLGVGGPWIIAIWTNGQVEASLTLVLILSASAFFHAVWTFNANLLVAMNQHLFMAKFALFGSASTLALSVLGTTLYALDGLAWASLIGEAVLALVCIVIMAGATRPAGDPRTNA
jgi:O-antigen/teichoic acid export membrane protein